MLRHRNRIAWRKAIFVLIACALVFVSSAQQFVVARSLATAEASHANHLQASDMAAITDHSHHTGAQGEGEAADTSGHLEKQARSDSPEPQNGPCCELSCVTFAVIATATIEIASPTGQSLAVAVFNDMTGHEVFDLMRPPRA